MVDAQGYVAVCALNLRQLAHKLKSAQQVAPQGLATDLRTLSRDESSNALWTHDWGAPPSSDQCMP